MGFGFLDTVANIPGVNNFVGDITGRTAIEAGDVAASNLRSGSENSINSQLTNAYLGSQQTFPQRVAAEAFLLGIPVEQTSAYQTQLQLYNRLPANVKTQIPAPTVPTGGLFDKYKEGGIQAVLQNLPGFQFGLQQQTRGLQNQASLMGNVLSSQNLKNLDRASQDYASTQYGNLLKNTGNIELPSLLQNNLQQLGQSVGQTQYETGQNVGAALSGALLAKAQASQNLLRTGTSAAGAASGGSGGMAAQSRGIAYL